MSCDTIIVIPCYNEERRLDAAALCKFVDRQDRTALLLVDDGSQDGTGALIELLQNEHPDRMISLRLPDNVGKAEAVRRGVRHALTLEPDFVGYWDADLSAPLSEIERLRHRLEEKDDRHVVLGSRVKMLGRTVEREALRHYLGRVFATLASICLRLPVYDTQCGAKLFRVTNATRTLFVEPFVGRWVFDVELLARWLAVGKRSAIYEEPLRSWINVEGSKVRPTGFLRALLGLWRIRMRYGSIIAMAAATNDATPAEPIVEVTETTAVCVGSESSER